MKPHKGSHSVYSIHLHFVFVTRYRRKVITPLMMERLREIFQRVCHKCKSTLVECNGEPDHVHLLVDMHPNNNVAQLIASLKSASSRIIRQEFAAQVAQHYSKPMFWSGSYYVSSTGGAPIEQVRQYIREQ